MKGKLILITGATSGIGLYTAKALASKGAAVIVVGRNQHKGDESVQWLKQKSSNKQIFYEHCDLASLKSVKELAYRVEKNYPVLDVLINNAGLVTNNRQMTEDGIELQFGVNHLSHFLLTTRLLDNFINADKPIRIINLSSDAHFRGTVDFNDLYGETKYRGFKAYCQSKLCNVLFTNELDRHFKEMGNDRITVNALHPGVVRTGIGAKNSGSLYKTMWKLITPVMITPEAGAATSVYLATAPELAYVSGKYWTKKAMKKSSSLSYDEQLADRLWNVSRTLCLPVIG